MHDVVITLIVFSSILIALGMILYRPAAFRKYKEKLERGSGKVSRDELLNQIEKLESRIDYLNATLEEERRKRNGY